MTLLLPLIIVPAFGGVLSYFIRHHQIRRFLWGTTAVVHFGLTLKVSFFSNISLSVQSWIQLDPLGTIFLLLISFLFLNATLYGINYMQHEPLHPRPDFIEGRLFQNSPESFFTGCMLLFLSSMSLSVLSHHFGLQWVSIEATTLFSAPLIYYHQHKRSLEAAWKYLLICSVGIALALLGIFFLAIASSKWSDSFTVGVLIQHATQFNLRWLEISFIFFLVASECVFPHI